MPEEQFVALIGNDQDMLIPRIAEKRLIGVKRYDADPPKEDKE